MPRRIIPFVFVALLSVLALASAILSIATEGRERSSPRVERVRIPVGSPEYGFGGYELFPSKPVTSVSGEWTVPRIAPSSGSGQAATWIGVQASDSAFIQIGTEESRLEGNQYYGFWSDVPHDFLPQFFVPAFPGDRVKAQMTMLRTGWAITLDNLTLKESRTFDTFYGANERFNSCEWFQENPTYHQFVHTNYPTLSPVTIEDMTLNHATPKFSLENALTLSTSDDAFFVPTPVRHDEFSLVPAKGSALRFLSDVYIEDELGGEFFEDATQGIEPSNATTNTYVAGLSFELPLLRAQRWPKNVAPAMARYIANQRHLESYIQRWLQEAPSERLDNLSKVSKQLLQADLKADKVRTQLDLPPVYG
jgi:hypothetical protein